MIKNQRSQKVEKLLSLDFKKEESKRKINLALSKTKWLKGKYEADEITFDILEILYRKVKNKYRVGIAYIMDATEESYSVMIKDFDSHEHVTTLYVHSLEEAISKALLILYDVCIILKIKE